MTVDDVNYFKINSEKIAEIGNLCEIIPINKMGTQKYMNMMHFFEHGIAKYDNIEQAVIDANQLMWKTIKVLSTHIEVLIGSLVRSKENKMEKPNWLIPDTEYMILRVKDGLKYNDSVTTSLSFENPKQQLSTSLFDERNTMEFVGARSATDYMFGEDYL